MSHDRTHPTLPGRKSRTRGPRATVTVLTFGLSVALAPLSLAPLSLATLSLAAVTLGAAMPAVAQDLTQELPARAAPGLQPGETWAALRGDLLPADTTDPPTDPGRLQVSLPARAEDAATVPLRIRQPAGAAAITRADVVVDENPAPLAGRFTFAEAMMPLDFELRLRVDQYSNVRVVADGPAGPVMDGGFVKASGGCSAPATKAPELAAEGLGLMKLREYVRKVSASETDAETETPGDTRRQAQIMIRHPNYSGLQRDQLTQLYIPAQFIDHLQVWQGEALLFEMEGGISISENPAFRFAYRDNGAPELRVRAHDTDGHVFEQSFVIDRS